jgi:SAM-dependent methyltransferase
MTWGPTPITRAKLMAKCCTRCHDFGVVFHSVMALIWLPDDMNVVRRCRDLTRKSKDLRGGRYMLTISRWDAEKVDTGIQEVLVDTLVADPFPIPQCWSRSWFTKGCLCIIYEISDWDIIYRQRGHFNTLNFWDRFCEFFFAQIWHRLGLCDFDFIF